MHLNTFKSECRLDVQDRVRRLVKEPREEDQQEVDQLRQVITAEFQVLLSLHVKAAESSHLPLNLDEDPYPQFFDDLDVEPESELELGSASTDTPEMTPERRPIPFPSNCLPTGHPLQTVELNARIRQARHYLNALREVVAEKSFHYSHVLRQAPNKTIKTRARGVIAKLNNQITLYCRAYVRTRAMLVRLGADAATLRTFQVLVMSDVRASTAILDPNEPGSSSLRLSWIWQTASPGNNNPAAVRECESYS